MGSDGPDGSIELEVRLQGDSLWLSQEQMALIFGRDPDSIGLHLPIRFRDGELRERATTEDSSVVRHRCRPSGLPGRVRMALVYWPKVPIY